MTRFVAGRHKVSCETQVLTNWLEQQVSKKIWACNDPWLEFRFVPMFQSKRQQIVGVGFCYGLIDWPSREEFLFGCFKVFSFKAATDVYTLSRLSAESTSFQLVYMSRSSFVKQARRSRRTCDLCQRRRALMRVKLVAFSLYTHCV